MSSYQMLLDKIIKIIGDNEGKMAEQVVFSS